MLSKEVQEIMEMLRKNKESNKGKLITPEKVLKDREEIDSIFKDMPVSESIHVKKIRTHGVDGELYTNLNKQAEMDGKILLFIHGGGFMTGSVLSRRVLCHQIIEAGGLDGFSVEYRQWPEEEHPKALADCVAAYQWLLESGYESRNIYIFGESAGAMLTLTMIHYLKDNDMELPGKALVFSPIAGQDLELPSHSGKEKADPMISYDSVIPYYYNADFKSSYVSPLYGDFTGFPPLSIHVGSEEVLFDDALAIKEKCMASGVDISLRIWDGLFHVFPLFNCPETQIAVKEIASFYMSER